MEEGKTYYYYVYYPDTNTAGCAKVILNKINPDSRYGLLDSFKIVDIIIKENFGNASNMKSGDTAGATDFQGVSASGIDKYFFDEYGLIQRIFKES